MNNSLYFFLSGEHPTLPKAEIKSIMEAEKIDFKTIGEADQLLRAKAPFEALKKTSSRSGMCKSCGSEILFCKNELDTIVKAAKEVDFSELIEARERYSVRIARVAEASRNLSASMIEGKIGKIIKERVKSSKVDLANPTKRFFGILTEDKFLLGLNFFEKEKNLAKRGPRKRPAFHPSTMDPKLARCIVNLSRAREDSLLLDPFCGVGGILIEAGMMGCRILGCDLNTKMIKGTIRNLEHFNLEYEGIILADARKNAFKPAESIATDPPYGKDSSLLGVELTELFRDFLFSAHDSLENNGHISISSPKGANISNFGEEAGLTPVETHNLYVHRSLTREILVFKR